MDLGTTCIYITIIICVACLIVHWTPQKQDKSSQEILHGRINNLDRSIDAMDTRFALIQEQLTHLKVYQDLQVPKKKK